MCLCVDFDMTLIGLKVIIPCLKKGQPRGRHQAVNISINISPNNEQVTSIISVKCSKKWGFKGESTA